MHLGHLSDGQLHDLRASVEFEARRRALPPLSGHHLGQHPPSHTSLPAVHVPLSPHGAPPTPGTGGGMPPAEHGAPPTVSGKGPVQLPALPAPATGASIDHVVSIPDKSKASPNDSTSGAGQIDLDAELNHLQDRIHHLKRRNAATDSAQNSARQSSAPTTATVTGAAGAGATGPAKGGHHFHHVSHMEHLSEDPVSQQDLDAELSSLEGHLHNIKKHQATYAAQAHAAPPPVAPVEMPHWEHHKYGHHQITDPAWKPTASITDIYGHQHKADEFHYNTYGAGALTTTLSNLRSTTGNSMVQQAITGIGFLTCMELEQRATAVTITNQVNFIPKGTARVVIILTQFLICMDWARQGFTRQHLEIVGWH